MEREVNIAKNATVMTIAGSDPSGGAGIQADLKAFQQVGAYGAAAITCLTVQNTRGVSQVEAISDTLVAQQILHVLDDIPMRVIKTGAMGNSANIEAVCRVLEGVPCLRVVDPVLISKHGDRLADDRAIDVFRSELLKHATILTPNHFEAEALLDRELKTPDDMANAAAELNSMGPAYVLLKGGAVDGVRHHFYSDSEQVVGLELEDIESKSTHGAGCCLSAVIAARLAITSEEELTTETMTAAVHFGIAAVYHAIQFAPGLGQGHGPVEHRLLHIGD